MNTAPLEKLMHIHCSAEEILRHIACGYSVRAACLACGIPPSTGRRWLQWLRDLEDRARTTTSPTTTANDRPF